MQFEDSTVQVSFSIPTEAMMGVEGMEQYEQYAGLSVRLSNRSTSPIIIDWNKVSFRDARGTSGNAVSHKDVPYKDCAAPKAPTNIPPGGILEDRIIPCSFLRFVAAGSASRWEVSMLPSPRKSSEVDFGLYLPLQIGDSSKVYEFDFKGFALTTAGSGK